MSSPPAIIRRYQITGRVQGVGFRAFVRNSARGLRLRGTVRNLADGSVECVAAFESGATGDRQENLIRDFEARLRKGPPYSRVDGVQSEDLAAAFAHELPPGFEII